MSKSFRRKIKFSVDEQIRLAHRLSALLSAGISIAEAFSFIGRSMSGKKEKVMAHIIEAISHGRLCSEIFSSAGAFNRSLVHMIAIGEKSGSLEAAFNHASVLLEKRQILSRKIYGALVYPGFIACVTVGISIFLVAYIFPKIIPLITSMNIPLPFLTKTLILISYVLTHYWLFLILAFGLFFMTIFMSWKYIRIVKRGSFILLMALPLAGSIFRGHILVQIFRPLGLLLSHGEHIPEALISVSGIIANDEYIETLQDAARNVTRGASFSGYISGLQGAQSPIDLFPRLIVDFLETGERTGGIALACGHIASLYESEVDESIKYISTIIEPVLMLGMGIIVGGIALSIVMPIYEITSYLSK